jgi:hypothetical protein
MKKVKLFEGFVKSLEESKLNESNQPSDYPGKFNSETAKANGEKWNGLDKWGYPLYTGESAVKLKEFLKNSLTNGKAVIVELKSGKKILVAKHSNGLYYYLADFNEPVIKDTIKQTIEIDEKEVEPKIVDKIEVKEEPEVPAEVVSEPAVKMIPLSVYIKGTRQKYKSHKDASGKRPDSLKYRGNLGKDLDLGYKEDTENGRTFFNGLEGKSYEYDPTTQQARELSDEEVKATKLRKYKRPKDKKVLRDFLKANNIKIK